LVLELDDVIADDVLEMNLLHAGPYLQSSALHIFTSPTAQACPFTY